MSAYLRVHSVNLELPLDLQRLRSGVGNSGFRASLARASRLYRGVLKNVSFAAQPGDRIALMGLNGAGKTTLLRVLNGAFPPTQGHVESCGDMQSLLNATLGFSEYATVAENVILRGTAMGLRRRQLEFSLPDILDFSALTEYANQSLHTLSSGQRMRLGFAISTAIQPDILLMDEWIATGDAAFLKRAQARMVTRFEGSHIVVLASHNTSMLNDMCNKGLVLHKGAMHFFGGIDEAIQQYRELVSRADVQVRKALADYDPMLFGGSTGLVERIRTHASGLELEGWAMGAGGEEVEALCVEIDGREHQIRDFERIDRVDVRLHLGRAKGRFGFRLTVSGAGGQGVDWSPTQLYVSALGRADRPALPLGLAAAALIERT
ncbi:ATP-binding cassette domain-containing protein [Lysobacter capsici]|uniref:ABC transporter ATP-binding protein n=1 Tax=Lysobacter capsici TaxID=435897 RepID=UPI000AD834F5|nr:ATP-binding cassette domain-containing protein [Lysobacter capsici]UOF13738.1 ATP-binding cassette domain-containing protein [Lysobacter capsici]